MTITGATRVAAVIGHPVRHSLSPALSVSNACPFISTFEVTGKRACAETMSTALPSSWLEKPPL